MIDIRDDLSKLTTIDKLSIDRIFNKIIWCISNCIERAYLSGEDTVDFDFGFGVISIMFEDNQIRYRFIPSQQLDSAISNTIINEKNELDLVLEKNLVQRITNIYKDMF